MRKFTGLRVLTVTSSLLLLLIAVPVVYGGLSWSGQDPQVVVNGATYNVIVAAPPNQWCKVDGPYQVTFHVQEGADYELIAETAAGPEDCSITSQTSFQEHDSLDEPYVTILVSARGKFRVVATVQSEDSQETCKGHANKAFTCDVPEGDDDAESDD